MKVAVSIPDEIFAEAEDLAKRFNTSRSELYSRALGTFIGLHAPGGDWSKKLTYPGPRCAVKERAVTAAIDWLRREVVKESRRASVPLAN